MVIDYTTVSEVPGVGASSEQMRMAYTRYAWAASFCDGKEVLDVGCGVGQGLGYLAKRTRRVVGGDYTERLLQLAQSHYGKKMPLVRLDAHALPFRARSFDVIILCEVIYYLSQPELFLEECLRLLRVGGLLLICTVNRECSGFNPSPFSTRYFSVRELSELLQKYQFQVESYVAFPVARGSAKDVVVSLVERIAVAFRLMPKTMKGKELLKRIFFGKLIPLTAELENGMVEYALPVPIPHDSPTAQHKVLYAVGRAPS